MERPDVPMPRAARMIAAALVVAMLHLSLAPALPADQGMAASDERREGTATQYGMGTASVFATLPYGLVKFLFATLGGIFGGFTYAFSGGNEKAAQAVWYTSMRGTYVITPEHLRGDRAVRFFGLPPERSDNIIEPVPAKPAEPAR